MRNILSDIRTQLGAILLILQGGGYALRADAQQHTERSIATVQAEVQALRVEAQSLRARTDSVNQTLRQVQALVRVKCVESRSNEMIREMLGCSSPTR